MSDLAWQLGWPLAWGRPVCRARLRATPEDFQVDELMPVIPSGAGEHVWLQVRKRDCNTRDVMHSLARFAGVAPAVIGHAGLKDRRAVTTQWFSVPVAIADPLSFSAWQMPGCQLLACQRHHRKLRPGTHSGNRFRIRLTALAGERPAIEQRLQCLRTAGVPNAFGEQRFGHARQNLLRLAAFRPGGRRPDRQVFGFWLSAARAFLFNEVLRHRVARGNWCTRLPGDVLMLDGSGSVFVAESDEAAAVTARLQAGTLHVAGPLWGDGGLQTQGEAAVLEAMALKPYDACTRFIARQRVAMHRRALRVRVPDLCWSFTGTDTLVLDFSLPAGSFATAVIREFCIALDDG